LHLLLLASLLANLGDLLQRSAVQALFGAGSGGGILAITAFNFILGSLCHFTVEVTLPTVGLLCHHEDDGAQTIGLSLSRLNHWLPRGQTHPEVVQGTAEFHHQIADPLLP